MSKDQLPNYPITRLLNPSALPRRSSSRRPPFGHQGVFGEEMDIVDCCRRRGGAWAGRAAGVQPSRGAAHQPGPLADNTDVYAFVSPAKRPDRVALIANFIPIEERTAVRTSSSSTTTCCTKSWWTTTPTPSRTSPTSSGSAPTSATRTRSSTTPDRSTSIDSANWNVRQFYSVTRHDGPRRRGPGTSSARTCRRRP